MRACRRLIKTSLCEMPCELQMFEATHHGLEKQLKAPLLRVECGLSAKQRLCPAVTPGVKYYHFLIG